MADELKFRPIEEDECLMPLKEFEESIECSAFIDYDGYGELATETEVSNIRTWPSKFLKTEKKSLPSWATHIAWYNR